MGKKYRCQESLRNAEQKWLPLTRKSGSPSRNKLSLAGTFFKNWIPSNFNNVFTSRKKILKSVSISWSKT